MRLKQIRLAGFKSFVDPTAFEVPSQLVGVVGPNGCGKSNIMDAVRWVLGESRAAELRGESMQDVIFNGSADRRPAARASVELVFDNSLGRIGGSWGSFAELSVKRVLTRDGQSSYLINNQQVRRKDVHDIFLGTGLGPRAYAIIGQGMIARIIEARPEDLRIFLEEAAGISRYKERRRETGNRLADTRDNLLRVEDIRRELSSQIDRLSEQAEVVRQFRDCERAQHLAQWMLWRVRRDDALAERDRVAIDSAQARTQLDGAIAAQRALEADTESLRAAHYEAGDAVHAAQGRHYDANAEVARLEAEIRFVLESQARLRERLKSLTQQIVAARDDGENARVELCGARDALVLARARADELSALESSFADRLPAVEAALRDARQALDEARAGVQSIRQAIELSAARQRSAQQTRDAAQRRQARLQQEADGVHAPSAEALEQMRETVAIAQARDESIASALAQAEQAWRDAEAAREPAQRALRDAESESTRVEARAQALKQVQERAQSGSKIAPWLASHGLDALDRLWHRLRIDAGWETALESVLRERVESIEVLELDRVAGLLGDAPPAKVAFHAVVAGASAMPSPPGLRPLSEVLRLTDAGLQPLLTDWLHGWFVVDTVDEALRRRFELPVGGRFVTPAGHVVGAAALQCYARDSAHEGVLARQQEIEHLSRELRARQLLRDDARQLAARASADAATCLEALSGLRDEQTHAARRLSNLRLDAQRLEQQHERAEQTRHRLTVELDEVRQAVEEAGALIDAEAESFERLDAVLAERQQAAEDLSIEFERAEAALVAVREGLRQAERASQAQTFATHEIEGRIGRLESRIGQSQGIAIAAQAEQAQLEEQLAESADAPVRARLDAALALRVDTAQALADARQRLDDITQALRALDERRLAVEREQEPLRQRLTELQLKEQAARLSAETFSRQLEEAAVDEDALRAAFPSPPKPAWLTAELARLAGAITALGPVNLAAVDELQACTERKGFLDAQSADLESAIMTLEDAIRRIDRETRELLQQTYDTVNREFGKLFPELFGGGDARLILTGDEILDAGVQVMAQPPGKRNSSIHLLSGGEKALTAIALVFAMFQLNPAPFCLLDEVDAPLDDANTERYADMVRRMSSQTQFLFITHNKIAMELAQQLVGVTMQERGVSRIVAVDMESAVRMVEVA